MRSWQFGISDRFGRTSSKPRLSDERTGLDQPSGSKKGKESRSSVEISGHSKLDDLGERSTDGLTCLSILAGNSCQPIVLKAVTLWLSARRLWRTEPTRYRSLNAQGKPLMFATVH